MAAEERLALFLLKTVRFPAGRSAQRPFAVRRLDAHGVVRARVEFLEDAPTSDDSIRADRRRQPLEPLARLPMARLAPWRADAD